ncbi:hypothetical protein HMPREF0539_1122 [Lacticaseibacillus rhamnosus LMS2-1]|uniref:Uncharacterized protein n=1 Tax=Lacticaseibacillus rhamnosus (strain LMS2-1) TaxID=525361 RepID=C2JW38_LACRM|nr:hypothetical protein HMPREF0539_1122 [Lacticaseibacillus rhamnosus LMS2-1]
MSASRLLRRGARYGRKGELVALGVAIATKSPTYTQALAPENALS